MNNYYLSIMLTALVIVPGNIKAISTSNQNETMPHPGINSSISIFTEADANNAEIIFYSNGSSFSPVIKTNSGASILWTWDDNTNDNSASPVKVYGTAKLRQNRLKVTPWSAVKLINIGYDAQDGGPDSIALVKNQQVSTVKNLDLVAPYLQAWCSSYNLIDSLNFSNFINLITIECFSSTSLRKVALNNTPRLRRVCLEYNNLTNLNLTECPALEDVRGALNKLTTIQFSNSTEELWHLCFRANEEITDHHLFNDITAFPNIAELLIWNTNQQGALILHSTRSSSVNIHANDNEYTSIDFTGAFHSIDNWGIVDLSNNKLTSVNINGCIQINELYITHNKLSSLEIDHILQQLDSFETTKGSADLRFNNPPTSAGQLYISNLKAKFWDIKVDEKNTSVNQTDSNPNIKFFPNPVRDNLSIELNDSTTKIIEVSIINSKGKTVDTSHPLTNKVVHLNMTKYQGGVYIIKILTAKNHHYYHKIVHIKQSHK
ncbi:MAG: T9SS type A sorting domain-containing protein [Bacteroidota bacterium]|nr:T9SS type A sorting domain-containing protein [Bacteroidota bacterium]